VEYWDFGISIIIMVTVAGVHIISLPTNPSLIMGVRTQSVCKFHI